MVTVGGTAVVIGTGVAGLSVARTLAGRFARVLVLERDELPDSAVPRRGVQQSGHPHLLLISGQRALETLFPGLMAELIRAGAESFDPGTGLSFHRHGFWPQMPTTLRLVSFSRPLLELAMRRRLAAETNVEIRDRVAVSALSGADGRVNGVRLDDGTVIDSDLVLDCTGRGGRSNRWLAELGFPAPTVSEVGIGAGYATRLYRRKPGDPTDAKAIFTLPSPPKEYRSGVALPVEDDRWLISMGGWHEAYPRDLDGFHRHARELPHPDFARLVEHCEPLTELAVCGFAASRRRHFEKLRRVPAGYLALGDALCSFNPIYGQGMACAALESVELGTLLDRHAAVTAALSIEHYRRASRIIATPWQFAAGGDFAYPETRGRRPPGIGLMNAYGRRIQLAAMVDREVREVFIHVQHLIMDPGALFTPSMVLKVLRAARRAPH